jgi:hypothetical protein
MALRQPTLQPCPHELRLPPREEKETAAPGGQVSDELAHVRALGQLCDLGKQRLSGAAFRALGCGRL